MATALQMLARCPTLLRFAPCIHAFMTQNLFARIMNTGSKQKKGDPDVQVRCANFPHFASFFRRVRTSRATRVVGFFPKKGRSVRLDVGEWAVVSTKRDRLDIVRYECPLWSLKYTRQPENHFVLRRGFLWNVMVCTGARVSCLGRVARAISIMVAA